MTTRTLPTRLISSAGCKPLTALALLAAAASASAEQAPSRLLEEVIVTAQKRAENVQDVPIAMQAFSAEDLQNARVQTLTDITQLAPNLNVVVQNALSQHIVIRGVGTNEFFGNAPSSVGMYMDEVTMNSSYMSTLGLFDMERIEVLRGPQNSLFGRNTTGGAINYISRQPRVGGGTEGYAQLTYGSDNLMEAEGGVTLPVGEQVAVRMAGMVHTRDGIWNNLSTGDDEYGDEDRYSLRATLAWAPSESTRFTLSGHHARDRSDAQPQKHAGALANDAPLRINDTVAHTGNIDWENPSRADGLVNIEGNDRHTYRWNDIYAGGSNRGDLDVDGGYLKIEHDFGAAALTSITSYDKTHAWYEEENAGSSVGAAGVNRDVLIIDMDQEYEQMTQEVRLASTDDAAALRWIAGVYYFKEDSLLSQNIRFGANGFPAAHPSAAGITPPELFDVIPNPYSNTLSFSIADLEDQSYSLYGQTDYDFAEQFTVTVGLRYTHDDKSNPSYYAGAFDITGRAPTTYYDRALVEQLAASAPACPGPLPFSRCVSNNTSRADLENDEVGGKIGLEYHVSDDLMLYGSYSRGFKSGKFDVEFLHTDDTPFPQRPLDPEILNVFELGLKSSFNDSLVFNAAVFYNIWKDQQVFNVGVSGPEFFNLPESEIYGAEAEVSWAPNADWLLMGSVGLLHTEITDATGIDFDLRQGDFQEGHELPLSPELTANAAIERRFHVGANSLSVRVDSRYQSKSKAKFSPQQPIDEYESRFEVNARATYAYGEDDQYEIAVFGDNLTEEKYCVELQDLRAVSSSYYCVPNDGVAQYGLQALFRF